MKNAEGTKIKINRIISFIEKYGIYILALGVLVLNFSLAFDNVVWGDEAYSKMAIENTNLHGVFERVYYWDSHPPLYYYYLKALADVFGYKTSVFHIASLIPFTVGIILAVTLIKKKLGFFPAAFFVVISGLSESCVEYNLEIRMYALVFAFVLLCLYCAMTILEDGTKLVNWIFMTLFGILAAYTHYYGLAICGLIIFFAGMFNLIFGGYKPGKRVSAVLKWVLTTLIYIVVYIPWLFVLYFQTQAELGNSWMTEPDPLSNIIRFVCGGTRLKPIVFAMIIVLSVWALLYDTGLLRGKRGNERLSVELSLHKPSFKKISIETKGILFCWLTIAVLLGFCYIVSYAFHPMLTYRYTYVIIPLVLYILMLGIKKMTDVTSQKQIFLFLLAIVLLLSLLDFKYFRSVSKTQQVETTKVLDIVGTPKEGAVMCSNGVKHLAWSVLKYYYDNEVTYFNPDEVQANLGIESDEFWCFNGYEYEDDYIDKMKSEGFVVEEHPDMWLGKYNIYLYHFYK